MTDIHLDVWARPSDADVISLRKAFGSFATGVTVVAANAPDGTARAFTANSFSSVSLSPALLLICLGKYSASLDVFSRAETFSVNVLQSSQRDISNAFASRDPEVKTAACQKLVGGETPYVNNSLATFICARHQIIDAGDHVILIGLITRFHVGDGQPLAFYGGGYVALGPDLKDIERLTSTVVLGGVLGRDGKVLLTRSSKDDRWRIPSTRFLRDERQDRALKKTFQRLGADVRILAPYSVFQEEGDGDMTMMFVVEEADEFSVGVAADGSETAFFGPDDEPWNLIDGEMKRSLLQRFLRELASGLYAVYFDTPEGGSVVALNGSPLAWSDWDKGHGTSLI